MFALCVDDEKIQADALKRLLEQTTGISGVEAFTDEIKALEWAQTHTVDIAFLDIEMHEMSGLELTEKLRERHPDMAVVFCTSYRQYAVDTMAMHIDAGYILKPFEAEQIQHEVEYALQRDKAPESRLSAVCFGDFEIYLDGQPIRFKRKKTKELVAYLIDRKGAVVSSAQAISVLWEDEINDEKARDYLYHLAHDLRTVLKAADMEDAVTIDRHGYAVNRQRIDCDYYRWLEGDETAKRQYVGEYMNQYSWAEETNAWLAKNVEAPD